MSFFSDRLGQGIDTLVDSAGETVTLSRASNTTEITAIAEDIDGMACGGKAARSNYWDLEWLIKQADYAINDTVVTPQVGDRITDDNGDVWELMLDGEIPEAVPHAGGYAWLVKTKRIVSG